MLEQTWLDEDTALKAAARKGWGFESLLLRQLTVRRVFLAAFFFAQSRRSQHGRDQVAAAGVG